MQRRWLQQRVRNATASPAHNSMILSRHATRLLNIVAVAPQIERRGLISAWIVACAWRRRTSFWVPYGNPVVPIRLAKQLNVQSFALAVRSPMPVRPRRELADKVAVNNDFDGLNPVSAWNIQTCDFGTYCCRAINDRRNCCNNSTAPRVTTSSIGAFQIHTATAVLPSSSTTPSAVPTATGSPSELEATPTSNEDVCKSEKHKTAVVGGALGGVLGTAVVGLMGVVYWMSKREQRQRKLKEHYEEQFAQTWAYRKAMAASSTSMKTDAHEEFIGKSSGS